MIPSVARNHCRRIAQKKAPCTVAFVQDATRCILAAFYLEDVVARGAEHSTLAAAVREAAARMNIDVSPDPHPESVLFIRSDQYSFVRQGVQSLSLGSGYKSSDPDIKPEEIRKAFLANRYHKPQEDMNQAFDFESGARFASYAFLLGYIVAQKTEKPAWNPRDFFGEKYARTKN